MHTLCGMSVSVQSEGVQSEGVCKAREGSHNMSEPFSCGVGCCVSLSPILASSPRHR